ncbi:MAG: ATPase, T2SS/T4P/T4SS family [Candidatus Aenigmatarchaeota archaeon]
MPCDYEYDEDEKRIEVNCSGCIYGSSVADYEECMANTIDKIMEVKGVKTVLFKNSREYEYPYEQTKLLVEIAEVLKDVMKELGLRKLERLEVPDCNQYFQEKYSELQGLAMDELRKDPVGAYIHLKRKIRHVRIQTKEGGPQKECKETYLNEVLLPIKERLEQTRMIKEVKGELSGYHPGQRDAYRELFYPSVRPNFMRTKYMKQTPEEGGMIDHYEVGSSDIEVYNLPDETRPLYHFSPPEFKLEEGEYSILDAAQRYLSEHRPETTEFAESERSREVFSSIGKDLIKDIAEREGTDLEPEQIERLNSILSRYTGGLGILEAILEDEKVQDIYINSPLGSKPIFINHEDYGECRTNIIPTQDDAESWATKLRLSSGRPLDEANPVLDTSVEVPGGNARVTVIAPTLAPEGLGLALRRHREDPWTYPLYLQPDIGYISPLFAGLMSFVIDGGRTFLIGGGRGSGKTSLLGASMLEMKRDWRVITSEDTLELPVKTLKKLGYDAQRLKSRSVITQVETELPASESIRTALRLGDSALIIGEVRSTEAQALYEAMRIGAMAKTVAGTIHGESAYGLFDRVVHDLGVPKTSFKATDLIVICNRIKSASGLQEIRRVTGVTEVRKHWSEDPRDEDGFVPLMEYSAEEDRLKPTDTLLNGESQVLNKISSQVKEWAGRWDRVWENIELRGKVKKAISDYALETGNEELMEAPFVVKSNSKFRLIMDEVSDEVGYVDPDETFERWEEWLKEQIKSGEFKNA